MITEIPASLQNEFTITESAEGALLLERCISARRMTAIFNVVAASVITGLAWALLRPAHVRPAALTDPILWFEIAGCLFILSIVFTAIWSAFGSEQWVLSSNALLWRGTLFGRTLEKQYTNGKLKLGYSLSRYSFMTMYRASVKANGRWSKRIYTASDRQAVEDVANFLARRLGWPIEFQWE